MAYNDNVIVIPLHECGKVSLRLSFKLPPCCSQPYRALRRHGWRRMRQSRPPDTIHPAPLGSNSNPASEPRVFEEALTGLSWEDLVECDSARRACTYRATRPHGPARVREQNVCLQLRLHRNHVNSCKSCELRLLRTQVIIITVTVLLLIERFPNRKP